MKKIITFLKSLFKDRDPLSPIEFELNLEISNNELKKPVNLIIKNDDTTPMDFVIKVLRTYFKFNREKSIRLMLQIHDEGQATIMELEEDDARNIANHITQEASKRGYPLCCSIENT